MNFIGNYQVKAGVSWHWRQVMRFEEGNYIYSVESESNIIKMMMETNINILHKLALFLVSDYEIIENWTIQREWKK